MDTYAPPSDPTLDIHDGSRAIEVAAMLGDTVLQVHHLNDASKSKAPG